jgi:ribosomal protein S25
MAAHIADVDVIAVAKLARRFAISAAVIAQRLLRRSTCRNVISLTPKRHDFPMI